MCTHDPCREKILARGDVLEASVPDVYVFRPTIILRYVGMENKDTMVYEVLMGTQKKWCRHVPATTGNLLWLVPDHEYLLLETVPTNQVKHLYRRFCEPP